MRDEKTREALWDDSWRPGLRDLGADGKVVTPYRPASVSGPGYFYGTFVLCSKYVSRRESSDEVAMLFPVSDEDY